MNWFKNLKLASRLVVGFSGVIVLTVALGIFSIVKLGQLDGLTTEIAGSWLPGVQVIGEIDATASKLRTAEYKHVFAATNAQMTESEEEIETLGKKLAELETEYTPLVSSEEERALKATFDSDWDKYDQVAKRALQLARAQRGPEAQALIGGEAQAQFDRVTEDLGKLRDLSESGGQKAGAAAASSYGTSRILILVGLLISTLLGFGCAVYVARLVSRPIQIAAQRADQLRSLCITNLGHATAALAKGDLDYVIVTGTPDLDFDTKDEVGDLARTINGMIAQTKKTVASFEEARNRLREVMQETGKLTAAAGAGKLAERGDAAGFDGAFREMVQGINQTLDAVVAPINEATTVLESVAHKDLTVRVKGDYKGDHARIKQALNSALDDLSDALSQVSAAAGQVGSASEQISAGSQTLAQGSSEQASALEEISSSLQEMSSMSKQNSANAQEANALANGAQGATQRGVDSMTRLSDAVERIKSSADQTAKIIKTIDEIAFQTNLLALNAAVEAARAGEAGKGFAVVAEEVRNLAMRSAEAARNTSELIEGSVKNAEEGVSLNGEVLGNLEEISGQVNKVREVMAEIAAASEQQTQGVDQINGAVEQMNGLTQSTAANSEESAAAAEELSSQAQVMLSLVNQFDLGIASHAAQAAGRPAAKVKKVPALALAGQKPVKKNGNGHGRLDAEKLIPFGSDSDTLEEF